MLVASVSVQVQILVYITDSQIDTSCNLLIEILVFNLAELLEGLNRDAVIGVFVEDVGFGTVSPILTITRLNVEVLV